MPEPFRNTRQDKIRNCRMREHIDTKSKEQAMLAINIHTHRAVPHAALLVCKEK